MLYNDAISRYTCRISEFNEVILNRIFRRIEQDVNIYYVLALYLLYNFAFNLYFTYYIYIYIYIYLQSIPDKSDTQGTGKNVRLSEMFDLSRFIRIGATQSLY